MNELLILGIDQKQSWVYVKIESMFFKKLFFYSKENCIFDIQKFIIWLKK